MARTLYAKSLFSERIVPDVVNGWTIEIPPGISLVTLRDSAVGRAFLPEHDWYDGYEWATTPVEAGTYRLRLPIPGSNDNNFQEQQSLLLPGETVAPVTLVAAALLCIAQSGGPDPLKGGWIRCAESIMTTHERSVVAHWCDGRLRIDNYWSGDRHSQFWLASAEISS